MEALISEGGGTYIWGGAGSLYLGGGAYKQNKKKCIYTKFKNVFFFFKNSTMEKCFPCI